MGIGRRIKHWRELAEGDIGFTREGDVYLGLAKNDAIKLTGQTTATLGTSTTDNAAFSLSAHDTNELREGDVNLYFTNARVYTKVKAILQQGSGITVTADDVAQTLTISAATATGGNMIYYGESTNGTDAYTITTGYSLAAYWNGMLVMLKPDIANTGECTLAVDGLAPIPIRSVIGGVPPDGYIEVGNYPLMVYNGVFFQVVNWLT